MIRYSAKSGSSHSGSPVLADGRSKCHCSLWDKSWLCVPSPILTGGGHFFGTVKVSIAVCSFITTARNAQRPHLWWGREGCATGRHACCGAGDGAVPVSLLAAAGGTGLLRCTRWMWGLAWGRSSLQSKVLDASFLQSWAESHVCKIWEIKVRCRVDFLCLPSVINQLLQSVS